MIELQVGGWRAGSRRYTALIDDEDAALAVDYRWSRNGEGYVCRFEPQPDGTRHTIYLHRQIMGLIDGDGLTVDHENRDRLDCRRSNMRLATKAEQVQNTRAYRGSSSRFRGVSWDKKESRWRAYASIKRRQIWLGRFDDELEAAAVARAFRLEHMPFAVD